VPDTASCANKKHDHGQSYLQKVQILEVLDSLQKVRCSLAGYCTIHRSPKKTVNVSPVSPRGAPMMGKNCPPSGEDVENYLVNVRKFYLVGG